MIARAIVLFACLSAGAVVIAYAEHVEPVASTRPLADFPMTLGAWTGVEQAPFDQSVLKVLGVDDYLTRAYFDSARRGVGLYVGYYRSQRQGDTMHSPLNCLPGAGWEPLSHRHTTVQVTGYSDSAKPSNIVVNRYIVQKGMERQLVLYWYQAHGRVVASEYWSKYYLIHDAIRLNRTDGALVRVITPVLGETAADETTAEEAGVAFVHALFPHLADYLPS